MLNALRLLCLITWMPFIAIGQPHSAKQSIRQMKQVHFSSPVLVIVRLNQPVAGAEYRMVMNRAVMAELDTLSLQGLLRHTGIYFAKVYTNTVPGVPRRKYYMATPEVADGLDPLQPTKFPFEPVEKPRNGHFYTRVEPAQIYRTWFAPGQAGDLQSNTLPGVDSVRVVYILKKRPRWYRHSKGSEQKIRVSTAK